MIVAESTSFVTTKDDTVSCDGGQGAQGHPKIYLDVKKKGDVFCPYCSKHFKQAT